MRPMGAESNSTHKETPTMIITRIAAAYHSFRCGRHNVLFARHYGTERGAYHSRMAMTHHDLEMKAKRKLRRARR